MLPLWLAGCHWLTPTVTDETAMAGFLRDPGGAPVVGQKVESVETSVLTDEEGRFGLHYKRPETYVHFRWNEMQYRRAYRPEDEGHPVEILLPPIRSLEVACGHLSCALTLDWDLADGLSARWDGRCEAGRSVLIPGAPQGVPAVACRPKVTDPPADLVTRLSTDRLELLPPPRPVRVEIAGDEHTSCRVSAGDADGEARPDGAFVVPVSGEASVQVVCDGRSALPAAVAPDADAVSVTWVGEGPELRPPPGMVLDHLILTREDPGGWRLVARASPDGGFLLPPLPAGRYAVQLHGGQASEVPVARSSEPPPDRLVGQMLASGQYAGALVLTHDQGDGVLQAGVSE